MPRQARADDVRFRELAWFGPMSEFGRKADVSGQMRLCLP